LFDDNVSTFFAEETSSTPAEVYVMSCDLATFPAPLLDYSCMNLVTIRFHNLAEEPGPYLK